MGTKEEVVGKVAKATKMVDCERKEGETLSVDVGKEGVVGGAWSCELGTDALVVCPVEKGD